MINMIMHHLRIKNNAASKMKFFIGLVIITILYIVLFLFDFERLSLRIKFLANQKNHEINTTTDETNYFLFSMAWLTFIILFCLLFYVRKNVMRDRKIYYSFWENCCMVFWCHSCVICQSANEYSGDDGKQFWKVEIV